MQQLPNTMCYLEEDIVKKFLVLFGRLFHSLSNTSFERSFWQTLNNSNKQDDIYNLYFCLSTRLLVFSTAVSLNSSIALLFSTEPGKVSVLVFRLEVLKDVVFAINKTWN